MMARMGNTSKSLGDVYILEAAGVFREYRDVHRRYTALALGGDLEALKRPLFLQWYALFEPACFTGLWEMDETCELPFL